MSRIQDALCNMNHVSCIMHHAFLLEAEAIGYKALKVLSGNRKRAIVHSVFDRALYIRIGSNSILTVIKDKDYISPTSILLRNPEDYDLKSIGIKDGMRVEGDKHVLSIGDNLLAIKLARSSIWGSPAFPKHAFIKLSDVSLNLRVLRDVIYTSPSREGLVPLLENVELYGPLQFFLHKQEPTISERARPNIETLMWGLYRYDLDMAVKKALPILGLGPGLTPSCDDFLAGLMLSLNLGGRALLKKREGEIGFYRKVSAEICRMAKVKTTIYSQVLLNQARVGEGPKAVVELIHGLLTKDPNHVAGATKNVMKIGETSGADIAIGIYYGIRFLLSKLEHLSMQGIEDFE
ncbi:MAG: DUF2877 domain-containing protein [Candidatus Dadabacteria bacterium]|nr:DUF2877 domain-containing protein [Candidatus Dadabacteria bacterium]